MNNIYISIILIYIKCWGWGRGLKVMPADATSPSLRRLLFSTLTCLCQERAVSGGAGDQKGWMLDPIWIQGAFFQDVVIGRAVLNYEMKYMEDG